MLVRISTQRTHTFVGNTYCDALHGQVDQCYDRHHFDNVAVVQGLHGQFAARLRYRVGCTLVAFGKTIGQLKKAVSTIVC